MSVHRIGISEDCYKKMLFIKSRMAIDRQETTSFNDVIEVLLANYEKGEEKS